MKKKKVRFLDIYSSFSEIEKKEFMEFTSINLFNKGRNYKEFLQSLRTGEKGILKLDDSKNDRTQSNRLSELTLLAEKFLTIKNFDSNKFCTETLLLDELNKRDIIHFYEQRYYALKKSIGLKKISFETINESYELNRLHKNNSRGKENSSETISAYRHNLDIRFIQFIIEILEYMVIEICLKNSDMSYVQTHRIKIFGMLDFNFILPYFKKHLPEYYHLVSFYYYIYRSFLNTEDTYNYYVARKILTNELKNISKEVRSELYQFMIEYNIGKMNDSRQSASKEIFYLVDKKLKEGMLDDRIKRDQTNSSFIDYTMNALSLKKFKWAENFINKFGELLQGEHKDDAIFLCRAFVEYYRKNFKACKEYVVKVKKINPYYYINASKLNLQSSYELNNFEECYTVLRRLQEYIRIQKKTSEHLIEYTREFCTSYLLLLRLKENPDKKNYLNLEYDLAEGNITGRKWIERKMKGIKISSRIRHKALRNEYPRR